jgi:hypothetical protein
MNMKTKIKFAELRQLLIAVGFREFSDTRETVFRHGPSGTLFVFRPYRSGEPVTDYNLAEVKNLLDARGLMSATTFEDQFKKAPA